MRKKKVPITSECVCEMRKGGQILLNTDLCKVE